MEISKNEVKDALDIVKNHLSNIGIDDVITVKIKGMTKHNIRNKGRGEALGCYRSYTQFTSNPIFWINNKFKDMVMEVEKSAFNIDAIVRHHLVDTMLHEYGHVIAEYIFKRYPTLFDDMLEVFDDEEDFAESFIKYAYNPANDCRFDKYIKIFVKECFE